MHSAAIIIRTYISVLVVVRVNSRERGIDRDDE